MSAPRPAIMSANVEHISLLTPAHLWALTWRETAMSRQKMRARSGREADANSERSIRTFALPRRSCGAASASRPLTPTRWLARSLWRHLGLPIGPGGRFLAGTAWNRSRNHQPLEITGHSSRFQRFHAQASRDARAPVCAAARAYTRGEIRGTVEPEGLIYLNQVDRGSREGSKRFQLGTVEGAAGEGLQFQRLGNILAGGNAAQLHAGLADRPIWGLLMPRAGESFRVFGVAGALDRVDLVEIQRVGRNGGILRFSGRGVGHVGRAMLEGEAQGLGIAPLFRCRRQPVRLQRVDQERAPLGRSGRHPPLPPLRRARALAPRRATVSEFGSAILNSGQGTADRRLANVEAGSTGRGGGARRHQRGNRATGRGERAFLEGSALRRAGQASGRRARVN